MTREEAVNYLTLNKPSSGYPGLCEAIDMAIAALSTPAAPAQDDALVADGKKLLAMILRPCKQRLEHEWHKCKRCILMEELGYPGDSLAKRALASLLSAPPAAPAPADLVATCEWSEDANGELAENAPEFLAPQPADGVTQAQHEIVASIIDMVEHDQSRRAEMNRLRADALRAVLARALASPAPPATNEHEQAAQQILVTLAPLVSDAAIVGRTYGWPEVLAVVNAAAKKLASPAPQPAESDGSVMVRIDRVYVDAMRGDGLTGPFACVRLVEYEGEPRLELTTAPVPTPDTAEWWREVAQGLGVEIAKLKALVSAPACVASTPQGDVCGLCGRASADHRGPENAAAPAPVEPPPADMATVYGKRFDAIKSADERLEAMRGKMPDAEIDVYKAVLAADARRKAQE